jgi:hypothetical protein
MDKRTEIISVVDLAGLEADLFRLHGDAQETRHEHKA